LNREVIVEGHATPLVEEPATPPFEEPATSPVEEPDTSPVEEHAMSPILPQNFGPVIDVVKLEHDYPLADANVLTKRLHSAAQEVRLMKKENNYWKKSLAKEKRKAKFRLKKKHHIGFGSEKYEEERSS